MPRPVPLPTSPRPSGDLIFPEGFMLGCASAAHQVEGGLDNDWTAFELQPGAIADGSVSGMACDGYRRYRRDLAQLRDLGQNAQRFSIEWARVEPRQGEFDHEALEHYADVVRTCRSLEMEPVVTLHHFTLPRWLAERGGLLAPDGPYLFARYAATCAQAFGENVRWWITLNEPGVLTVFGYLFGTWPPQQRSQLRFFAALRAAVRWHAAGRAALREVAARGNREALVSVAHHDRAMRPLDPGSLFDRLVAQVPNQVFNRWFLRACTTGRLAPPVGLNQVVAGAARSLDYVGLNYYSEDVVQFDPRWRDTLYARPMPDPALPLSTFGSSIDPPGLTRALTALWQEFGLPILITENGVADADDELRPGFLVDHLAAVHDAVRAGVDVRGYLHWTALDNFEWTHGYSQHFGLFAVDRETMVRTPKRSAEVYATICRARGVPESLLATRA